jgi:Tol biopolymer transport system component
MDANGANPTQLTTDLNTHGQLPDWSPDGSKIAYQDVIGGFGRILVMNADGSNPTQLTFGPGDDFVPPGRPTEARSPSCATSAMATARST